MEGHFNVNPYMLEESKVKFSFNDMYVLRVRPKRPVAQQQKRGSFNRVWRLPFLLCITYAHIDWYFPPTTFHPYQSLSMSPPYTGSLPFPSCLFRISQTAFKKDFHKRPSFANPPQPPHACAESHLYLNIKGHWRRLGGIWRG